MKSNSFHDYAVSKEIAKGASNWIKVRRSSRIVDYRFSAHYHPFTDELIEQLNLNGLPALLDPNFHADLEAPLVPTVYTVGSHTSTPFPVQEIDVADDGPYAVYNWELFFHAPVLIATHLSKNQRFADAQRWFHYVFDPTTDEDDVPAPQRFWRFLRFRDETTPEFIGELLTKLADGTDNELKARLEKAITAWRKKPFQPHVIARGRALAYQLNVVMKYLDNLLDWGDSLFRQDTI